jgi:hypothetical protein
VVAPNQRDELIKVVHAPVTRVPEGFNLALQDDRVLNHQDRGCHLHISFAVKHDESNKKCSGIAKNEHVVGGVLIAVSQDTYGIAKLSFEWTRSKTLGISPEVSKDEYG